MAEIVIRVEKRYLIASSKVNITTGSVGSVQCSFSFDEEWGGLTKTALFKAADGQIYPVLLTEYACIVPNEAIKDGYYITVGIMGTRDGNVVIATAWTEIAMDTGCYETVAPPSEDIYLQILNAFNDFSPTISVDDIEGGHRITITDVNGTKTFDVMDGVDGNPGTGEIGDENFATDDEVVEVLNDIFGSDAVNE